MAKMNEETVRAGQRKDPNERVAFALSLLDEERKAHDATKKELAKAMKEVASKRGFRVNEKKHEPPKPVIRRT